MLNVPTISLGMKLRYAVVAGATLLTLATEQENLQGKYLMVDPATNKEIVLVSAVNGPVITVTPALANAYESDTSLVRLVPGTSSGLERFFFVPAVAAYQETPTAGDIARATEYRGWPLIDGEVCAAEGDFIVPFDFSSTMEVYVIGESAGTGDLYYLNNAALAKIDGSEGYANHFYGGSSEKTLAVTAAKQTMFDALAITHAAPGEMVHLRFTRNASAGNDTIGDYFYVVGWIVYYTVAPTP